MAGSYLGGRGRGLRLIEEPLALGTGVVFVESVAWDGGEPARAAKAWVGRSAGLTFHGTLNEAWNRRHYCREQAEAVYRLELVGPGQRVAGGGRAGGAIDAAPDFPLGRE